MRALGGRRAREPLLDEIDEPGDEAGSMPGVGVRTARIPASAAASIASVSRSQSTSMWSLMKPSGTIATASTPAAGSSAMTSLMSGSSHGCVGGPDRDW